MGLVIKPEERSILTLVQGWALFVLALAIWGGLETAVKAFQPKSYPQTVQEEPFYTTGPTEPLVFDLRSHYYRQAMFELGPADDTE